MGGNNSLWMAEDHSIRRRNGSVAENCELGNYRSCRAIAIRKTPGRRNSVDSMVLSDRPIRILQVVYPMRQGGTEIALMTWFRLIDRTRFHCDFLVAGELGDAPYYDEIQAHHSKIYSIPRAAQLKSHIAAYRRIMREHGPYDIVHCHATENSLVELGVALTGRIPGRIAHVHTDFRNMRIPRWWHDWIVKATRPAIKLVASHILGCSERALRSVVGRSMGRSSRFRVLYNGIDAQPFRKPTLPHNEIRRRLAVSPQSRIVVHVGRFVYAKNHTFLVEVARHLLALTQEVVFAFAGDGELRHDIERQAAAEGIARHVRFLGSIDWVPALLRTADLLLLPSRYEGLPLTVIEAQAAGTPAIISDFVTPEVTICPELVTCLPLSTGAAEWAQKCLELLNRPPALSREESLARFECSPFDSRNSARRLSEFYEEVAGLNPTATSSLP